VVYINRPHVDCLLSVPARPARTAAVIATRRNVPSYLIFVEHFGWHLLAPRISPQSSVLTIMKQRATLWAPRSQVDLNAHQHCRIPTALNFCTGSSSAYDISNGAHPNTSSLLNMTVIVWVP
jgi:hypothetical protein